MAVPFNDGQEDDDNVFFPYLSSLCHPQFIPKYSYMYWERAAGGAAHVATLGIPMVIQKLRKRELPWPTFTSNDEMCVECKRSPGSEGCMDGCSKYRDKIVDHTSATYWKMIMKITWMSAVIELVFHDVIGSCVTQHCCVIYNYFCIMYVIPSVIFSNSCCVRCSLILI